MAQSLHLKRMSKERPALEAANPDYFVHFKDEDLTKFEAYVLGPEDSLYRHKFVKLAFEIPREYPIKPPSVKFIQHTGQRIHPNLYVDGKVCLSILGTWQGPGWAFGMNCHTVLITIRSLLDNSPYQHEPNGHDKPGFNNFVRLSTWRYLLLDYLNKESEEAPKKFLQNYVEANGAQILDELARQEKAYGGEPLSNPYCTGRGSQRGWPTPAVKVDYEALRKELIAAMGPLALVGDRKRCRDGGEAAETDEGNDNKRPKASGASAWTASGPSARMPPQTTPQAELEDANPRPSAGKPGGTSNDPVDLT